MNRRGEVVLLTLIVVFVIGGLSAVVGYLSAPACPYQPPSIASQSVPHIPGK